jgi:hypothetical protein
MAYLFVKDIHREDHVRAQSIPVIFNNLEKSSRDNHSICQLLLLIQEGLKVALLVDIGSESTEEIKIILE